MEKNVLNKIKYLISKKKSGIEICSIMGIEMQDLFACVEKLNREGFNCMMIGDNPVKIKGNPYEVIHLPESEVTEYCFVSDLHLGSTFDRPDILRRIYAECYKRGITKIFCCGDITDGYYPNRPRYENHQAVVGYDNVLKYVVNTLPEFKNITMYAISGNHDDTFETGECESLLNSIAYFRKDFVYLGKDAAELTLDDTRIKLLHGYSKKRDMDKRLESTYESIPEYSKPDILALGHIHTSAVRKYGSTLVLQCASLMDNPTFLSKKYYDDEKSCFFVKVYHDEYGNILNTEVEQMSFEDTIVLKRVPIS